MVYISRSSFLFITFVILAIISFALLMSCTVPLKVKHVRVFREPPPVDEEFMDFSKELEGCFPVRNKWGEIEEWNCPPEDALD